jgi:predicted nucleic acid-binding protein
MMADEEEIEIMPSVYLETSVISYLTARPSRDIVIAGHQQITNDWWQTRRTMFDLYISEFVLREARRGDTVAAQERLAILNTIEIVEISPEALALADRLIAKAALPEKSVLDALHIATSVTNGIDFLLTWNCKHIANAIMRSKIEQICRTNGYEPSIICTPEELMEDEE